MVKINPSLAARSEIVVSHVFGCVDGYESNLDGYGGKNTVNATTAVDIALIADTTYRVIADTAIYIHFHDGDETILDDGYGAYMPADVPEVFRTTKSYSTLSVLGSGAGSVWVNRMRDRDDLTR